MKMSRLAKYRTRDDASKSSNSYATFANDSYVDESNENLSFDLVKKSETPKSNPPSNRKPTRCCSKLLRRCCPCCNFGSSETVSDDIDAEFAMIKYEQSMKVTPANKDTFDSISLTSPSQMSTLRMTDQPKTSASARFVTEVLSCRDKFLDKLEQDKDRGSRGRIRGCDVPSISVSLAEGKASDDVHEQSTTADDVSENSSPLAPLRSNARNTLTSTGSTASDWSGADEDIDRLVALHQTRSLSSLGLRSDSMASVYSGAGEGRYGTVSVKGEVEFSLQYSYKPCAFQVRIKQCRDLAPVDVKRNRSDPYVKVYLLPDKSKGGKRKTKVKKHTLNPVFDETLSFQLSLEELKSRTLWLTVWHSDMFGRNDFLGEVMMGLEDKVFDDPSPKWYMLQERTEPFEDVVTYKGEIIVGLKFVPPDMTLARKGKRSRGALHVLIKEAKNLTAVKANGSSDPFCKSYLLPDKGRSSKQKTPVLRRCLNPTWNYTFVYDDVTLQELSERALELTVWDHDRLGSNEFLGVVRCSLGTSKHHGKTVDWMDATDKEVSLWQSMLGRPNFWVEGCLSLRPSLSIKSG